MNLTLITHLIVAAVAALAAWVFQDARMDAAVAEVRLEQSNERLGTVSQARADERAINKTYQEALNDARIREASTRSALAAARAESDGLREQSLSAARRIADLATPDAAVREYAAVVNGLFAQCQRDYQDMAGQAQGHANDVRTLSEAWPVMKTE